MSIARDTGWRATCLACSMSQFQTPCRVHACPCDWSIGESCAECLPVSPRHPTLGREPSGPPCEHNVRPPSLCRDCYEATPSPWDELSEASPDTIGAVMGAPLCCEFCGRDHLAKDCGNK
jgi:hypothetical protein